MAFETPLSWVPDLEDAIERQPLVVPPETPLVDAIALISQAHGKACGLVRESMATLASVKPACTSCLLVIADQTLLGILTERDVVRLTAQAIDFQCATVADVMVHPLITLPEQSVQDISAALFLFRRYRIRHLPIVNCQGHLVGVISHESIRQVLRPANLLRFRRVSDVMTTDVIHAPLTTSVLNLAQLMALRRISCVVITQTDSEGTAQPVGIVTERDMVQFQALQLDLARTEAQAVMSSPLFLLNPDDSLWTAQQEMQKRRVGRLVVSWNWGNGLGIVTQTSLLRIFDPMEMYGVIETLQQTIRQMEAKQARKSLPNANATSADATSADATSADAISPGELASQPASPLPISRATLPISQATAPEQSAKELRTEEPRTKEPRTKELRTKEPRTKELRTKELRTKALRAEELRAALSDIGTQIEAVIGSGNGLAAQTRSQLAAVVSALANLHREL